MIGYKYRSDYQRDVLSLVNNEIFASPLKNLNDPFEGLIDSSDVDLLGMLFKKESKNVVNEFNNFSELINKKGIYCLSKTFANEVMWSLYADSHKGFCVEYDLEKILEIYNFYKIRPLAHLLEIKYQNTIPQNLFTNIILKKDLLDTLQGFAGIKSKAWEYEKEVRIISEFAGLLDYDFRALKSIYFGVRANEKDINQTIKSLNGRGIKFYKMSLKPFSYSLVATEIKNTKVNVNTYRQHQILYANSLLDIKNLQENYIYKNLFEQALNHIAQIPNIISIDSIDVDSREGIPSMNVFTTTNLKNFELRFIKVVWKNDKFYFEN